MALTTNLVSYWKFDEASTGVAPVTRVDSFSTNNLTDNNTTASAAGIINNGCNFQLINSEYLSIANGSQAGLNLTGDFSFSFWLKLATLPAATQMDIICKDNVNVARSYSFNLQSNNSQLVMFNGANQREMDVTGIVSVGDIGVFAHYVVTWDSAGNTGVTYKNAVAQTVSFSGTATAAQSSAADFMVGARKSSGTAQNFVNGVVDEVGVWSRVLTSAEVTQLYNGGSALPFSSFTTAAGNFFMIIK